MNIKLKYVKILQEVESTRDFWALCFLEKDVGSGLRVRGSASFHRPHGDRS